MMAEGGPINLTAREIRIYLAAAERRRRAQERLDRPFRALDRLIGRLEALHLKGLTELPPDVRPMLDDVNRLLPAKLRRRGWARTIAAVIDQCFDLQEALLRLRQRN